MILKDVKDGLEARGMSAKLSPKAFSNHDKKDACPLYPQD